MDRISELFTDLHTITAFVVMLLPYFVDNKKVLLGLYAFIIGLFVIWYFLTECPISVEHEDKELTSDVVKSLVKYNLVEKTHFNIRSIRFFTVIGFLQALVVISYKLDKYKLFSVIFAILNLFEYYKREFDEDQLS